MLAQSLSVYEQAIQLYAFVGKRQIIKVNMNQNVFKLTL